VAVVTVGLILLGVALWLARQRRREPVGHADDGHRGPDGRRPV
jgi:LPXTG-motif cell wall-anchored protein